MVSSLFQCCVHCILRSLFLLRKAPLHLPQRMAHYILYEACRTQNVVAVQNLTDVWPYSSLSFDFLSNPLCRWEKESSSRCLEPYEYYGVFSNDDFTRCILSIAVGIFHNVYHRLCIRQPLMNFVDLSDIRIIDTTDVDVVCKLLCGEFPGRHTSDYLSSEDLVKVRGSPKPHLSRVCASTSSCPILYVNIPIHSPRMLERLLKSSAESKWFHLVLKGLNLTLLDPKYITSALQKLDLSELRDLHLSTSLGTNTACLLPVLSTLPQSLSLWLSNNLTPNDMLPILQSVGYLRCLLVTSKSFPVFEDLANANCNMKALTVILSAPSGISKYLNSVTTCLQSISKSLEYLQLRSCLLSSIFAAVQTCSRLRVLSVSHSGGSYSGSTPHPNMSNVFKMLAQLSSLEFFEWTESLNMQTKDILSLHRLLSDALPKLRHWHMNFPYLLVFTTDLENQEYGPIMPLLQSLLQGKTGDESCVTYKFSFESEAFKVWLSSLRLNVCFRSGKYTSYLQTMY